MSASKISSAIRIAQVLFTKLSDATKKILAQVGNVSGQGLAESDNIAWWQHVGFASRPAKAVAGKGAAEVIVVQSGPNEIAIASQDTRDLGVYGSLKDGETCVYATGADGTAQARILLKADGGINLYTVKGNTPGGTGMLMQMDAAAGAIRLVNDKGYGLIIDSSGVKLFTSAGALTIDSSGNASLIGTKQTQVDGSSVVIGSTVVPVVNAPCCGPTGIASKASLKVLIE